jgi:c-di-GMP phosphodiesterase Gmr
MQGSADHELRIDASETEDNRARDAELGFFKDVLKNLPAGVTVQDEHGRLLLVNDAAARQLGMDGSAPAASVLLGQRSENVVDLLQSGCESVAEECVGEGQARQVLLTSRRPVRIGGRDLLLSSSADISEQKAFEDQLFRSAYYDELTGLPARRVIEHRVNGLMRRGDGGGKFALAFLDIDNFKHINDYYGHAIGDQLLGELAKRLGRELRDTDMLSRISGDEFLLLLAPVQSLAEVAEFFESALQRLNAPFFIDGSEIFASTSVGVGLYPDHGESYDTLCQNADLAMYRVKNDGKGKAAFFDLSMEHEASARIKVEQSLRLAILEKRFCCAFQAKVDIRTQEIEGIEALVRLRDHEGVIQAPGTFVNLAVELGLIDELTHSAGRDRQIDRSDQRNLRSDRDHQHQCRRQAGGQRRIHALLCRRARGDRLPQPLHDRGDGGRLRHQDPFPG